jgi:hypothetical protein
MTPLSLVAALGAQSSPPTLARQLIVYTVTAFLTVYLLSQVRKPSRWVGQPFLLMMNTSHSPVTKWGLTHVTIEKPFSILDVGYGGGRFETVQRLVMKPLRAAHLGVEEHRELLVTAGFADVNVFEERSKSWICVTGRAPAPVSA